MSLDTTLTAAADLPSGRFVLRIEPSLHQVLRDAAAATGVSLNEYCARALTAGGAGVATPGWRAVERAAEVVHGALVGVVVYGSWARGETVDTSDVDVLVVLDEKTAVTRELYRRWDAEPVRWEGRRVEPHFVHLPPDDAVPGGTWAEVALDGLVLFDRDLLVSRRLVAIRRMIVDGTLRRGDSHGQPYWVQAS